jgi:hypothetical protein
MNELATLFAVGMILLVGAFISIACHSVTGKWPWEKL